MKRARTQADHAPANAALDALAAALAPRVARLLREQAADNGDDALAEVLARAGYELEDGNAS